jgi:hypothetical protein
MDDRDTCNGFTLFSTYLFKPGEKKFAPAVFFFLPPTHTSLLSYSISILNMYPFTNTVAHGRVSISNRINKFMSAYVRYVRGWSKKKNFCASLNFTCIIFAHSTRCETFPARVYWLILWARVASGGSVMEGMLGRRTHPCPRTLTSLWATTLTFMIFCCSLR